MWKVFMMLAVVTCLVVGCDMARRVDRAVWSSPPPAEEGEAPAPPPIVEIIAGLLAFGGFGGMATWLKRQGNGTKRELDIINARLVQLESAVNPVHLNGAVRPGGGGG